MIAVETLGIRFLEFGHILNDGLGETHQTGEAAAHRSKTNLLEVLSLFLLGGCYLVPRVSKLSAPIGFGADLFPEVILVLLLFCDDVLIQQAVVLAYLRLISVLEFQSESTRLASLLRTHRAVGLQDVQSPVERLERLWVEIVTFGFYLGHGQETIGRSGVSGDKDQVSIDRAFRVPFQVVLALNRLV